MIKIEKTEVFNFEGAIRGMRNPMNSWDKSDSGYCAFLDFDCDDCPTTECQMNSRGEGFILGPNDLSLARRLIKAGSDHRKFLRQIFVSVDITAPLYWWKEYDTYKVATVANSTSTMHKIHAKEFTLDDFSHEHLLWSDENVDYFESGDILVDVITMLNIHREQFLETKDKKHWWQMIQLLPSSYNQMRTVTLNYETLLNIYHARNAHKLDEWHEYCDWIKTLPYFKEICLEV